MFSAQEGPKGYKKEVQNSSKTNQQQKCAKWNVKKYVDRIYAESQFIYVTNHLSAMKDGSGDWGIVLKSDASVQSVTAYNLLASGGDVNAISTSTLTGGTDDYAVTDGEQLSAYNLFKDAESEDVNLIMAAKASQALANNLITISENRKDCMTFISPERADVVGVPNQETITVNVTYTDKMHYNENITSAATAAVA